MIRSLRQVIAREPSFHECRDCGTAVDPPPSRCPACGSEEIASYEF